MICSIQVKSDRPFLPRTLILSHQSGAIAFGTGQSSIAREAELPPRDSAPTERSHFAIFRHKDLYARKTPKQMPSSAQINVLFSLISKIWAALKRRCRTLTAQKAVN
jgi:hypothetical protein